MVTGAERRVLNLLADNGGNMTAVELERRQVHEETVRGLHTDGLVRYDSAADTLDLTTEGRRALDDANQHHPHQ